MFKHENKYLFPMAYIIFGKLRFNLYYNEAL
jgi:hypothetical protein